MSDSHDDEGSEGVGAELDQHFGPFAEPLGHVILEFNLLEIALGNMLARLLKANDSVAAVFIAQMSFSQRLTILRMVAKAVILEEGMRKEFKHVFAKAEAVNTERNRYIHAEYMPTVGPDDRLMAMMFRRLRDSTKTADTSKGQTIFDLLTPLEPNTLQALANEIHLLTYDVRVLTEKFADWS